MEQQLQIQSTKSRRAKEFILEILRIVIISVAIIVPIRYYLVQPFYVKGASMEPNFHDHEYLLIDEISYRFRAPERGEIVVFRYPLNPSEYFIKRIIGLPGETVSLRDGKIYIYNDQNPEGFLVDESTYLSTDVQTLAMSENTVALAADHYFVFGDNRTRSMDSRQFGSIARSAIVGRVVIRGYPFDRLDTFFTSPQY
jgi:signal peptidase I